MDEHLELLIRIDERTQETKRDLTDFRNEMKDCIQDHDRRIRALETKAHDHDADDGGKKRGRSAAYAGTGIAGTAAGLVTFGKIMGWLRNGF